MPPHVEVEIPQPDSFTVDLIGMRPLDIGMFDDGVRLVLRSAGYGKISRLDIRSRQVNYIVQENRAYFFPVTTNHEEFQKKRPAGRLQSEGTLTMQFHEDGKIERFLHNSQNGEGEQDQPDMYRDVVLKNILGEVYFSFSRLPHESSPE